MSKVPEKHSARDAFCQRQKMHDFCRRSGYFSGNRKLCWIKQVIGTPLHNSRDFLPSLTARKTRLPPIDRIFGLHLKVSNFRETTHANARTSWFDGATYDGLCA